MPEAGAGTLLRRIGRLADGRRPARTDVDLAVVDGRIAWIGDTGHAPPRHVAGELTGEVDCAGGLVTPGLIDAHTHPVYAGRRFAEIAARTAGRPYGAGGGIPATVQATRAADWTQLEAGAVARLQAWLRAGTTTVEAKTGYHLTRDGELGATALLARLAARDDLPRVSVTFLAAHVAAPEIPVAEYVEQAAGWAPAAAAAGAVSVDCFCDEGAFTVDQARRVLTAGAAAGLTPRMHADELARTGGAQLAAELRAASADHLLRLTADDARALADAGVVAVLCPPTGLALGARPDVAALRAAGATLALGSDHNPGMSGISDMSLVIAQAATALGLSVDEALAAATSGAADALGRGDLGRLEVGGIADLVAWDADHEGAFAWAWGLAPVAVWRAGRRAA